MVALFASFSSGTTAAVVAAAVETAAVLAEAVTAAVVAAVFLTAVVVSAAPLVINMLWLCFSYVQNLKKCHG